MADLLLNAQTSSPYMLHNTFLGALVGGAIGSTIPCSIPFTGALAGAAGCVAAVVSMYTLSMIWNPECFSRSLPLVPIEFVVVSLMTGATITVVIASIYSISAFSAIATTVGAFAGAYFATMR